MRKIQHSMRYIVRFIAFPLFILGVPTHALAALIDFEGLTNGEVVTNQFPEVIFSANAGFENRVTTQPGIGFGDNFICTSPTSGSINCTQ